MTTNGRGSVNKPSRLPQVSEVTNTFSVSERARKIKVGTDHEDYPTDPSKTRCYFHDASGPDRLKVKFREFFVIIKTRKRPGPWDNPSITTPSKSTAAEVYAPGGLS